MTEYNVYCDESCHLENDGISVMVLGGVWCPKNKAGEVNMRIMDIKKKSEIHPLTEVKWTKVSPSKLDMYSELVNYFFDNSDLHFRGLLVPDKGVLNHKAYNQTHDDWYYKMYFDMLKTILTPSDMFNIYIDIKDNHSYEKSQKLMEVCRNKNYDFSGKNILKIQPIRSHEVQVIQLADILIGALGYANRHFEEGHRSIAKSALIDLIKNRSRYSLTKTTLYREEKFNILAWEPKAVAE